MVAVLLGLRARAVLHSNKPGCGATDIDAPEGLEGDERLLVALVAGSVGEGRLLHQARQWHVSTEDARAIVRLVGGITDSSAKRVSRARNTASKQVRDKRVWSAVEAVAGRLAEHGEADHRQIRAALAKAGLEPGPSR